ncbi:hypothetical protein [Shinella sp. M27]|uniref:hypothetical protein n=1 Tax=Shinella sp. M27 TaxID=3368614 RepID=UPI003B9E810B
MQRNSKKQQNTVAASLRPVAFVYAAINLAVVALLISTVSPTLATGPAHTAGTQEMASLR